MEVADASYMAESQREIWTDTGILWQKNILGSLEVDWWSTADGSPVGQT